MSDTQTRNSLTETKNELQMYLRALSIVLNDFYGPHALRAVLKGNPEAESDHDVLENADLSSLRFCQLLPDAYDYAFNGRMSAIMEVQAFECPSIYSQLNDFLLMLEENELIHCVLNDASKDDEPFTNGGLRALVDMGYARASLDQGLPLHAKQIAALAGIEERSVQNAFSATGNARLTAIKDKRLGASYVEAEEAVRWLSTKKGFIPTSRRTASDEPLIEQPLEMTMRSVTSRGKNKDDFQYPHKHSDGFYVASFTKKPEDYVRVADLESLIKLWRGGLRIKMSAPGIPPSLVSPESIELVPA